MATIVSVSTKKNTTAANWKRPKASAMATTTATTTTTSSAPALRRNRKRRRCRSTPVPIRRPERVRQPPIRSTRTATPAHGSATVPSKVQTKNKHFNRHLPSIFIRFILSLDSVVYAFSSILCSLNLKSIRLQGFLLPTCTRLCHPFSFILEKEKVGPEHVP